MKDIYARFERKDDGSVGLYKLFEIDWWSRRGGSDEYQAEMRKKFFTTEKEDKFQKTYYLRRGMIHSPKSFFHYIFQELHKDFA
jgi:hypothetical protein